MENSSPIPREIIQEILTRESDDRRLEEFSADVFSAIEGWRYTTTAPTSDRGRDAYAELVNGFALICGTVTKAASKIKGKIREDIDKQHDSPMSIRRFHYCTTYSLDEDSRDELKAYGKANLTPGAIVRIQGLTQMVDFAYHKQEIFASHYSRELASIESLYRRSVEGELHQKRNDVLRIVLGCTFHPEIRQQREAVIRHLILLALEEEKPKDIENIITRVGAELSLEHAPRHSFVAEGLQRLIDDSEVIEKPSGYIITAKGVVSVQSQIAAAAAASLDGRKFFLDRLGAASMALTPSRKSEVWDSIQFNLAERFILSGMRFVEDLRQLGGAFVASSTLPEFQAFISETKRDIQQLGYSDDINQSLASAVDCFGDPSDEAFTWLTQTAVKYLVLCTLGLDPEVERQVHKRFSAWTFCPDTHILLSYICEGDEGHTRCESVLTTLHKLNAEILILQAVVEETAHHAVIARKNLEEVESRYFSARRNDPSIHPYAVIRSSDNAYVKYFAFLCGESWKRSEWQNFIGSYFQVGTDYAAPLRRLLANELAAKHLTETKMIREAATAFSEQTLSRREDVNEDETHKNDCDVRLIASAILHATNLPSGRRLIIVTDSKSIRRFHERMPVSSKQAMNLTRPATLAYALMLVPGSHMNLKTVQGFIVAPARHGLVSRNLPPLSQVMPHQRSAFKRPSQDDAEIEEGLIRDEVE